jgi:acetyl esterase/lipase
MKFHIRLLTLILPVVLLFSACIPINATLEGTTTADGTVVPTSAPVENVSDVRVEKNITYANPQVDGVVQSLKLDIYIPQGVSGNMPGLVYIHGGGWMEGSKSSCPGKTLAKGGYVVACIDYRLVGIDGDCSKDSIFPAAVQDVKSAVRWLRQNARSYSINPDKIGLIGDSSGGHLAVLAGVSKGAKIFNNTQNSGPSDAVQAIVDWYGPVDVTKMEIAFTEDACKVKKSELSSTYGDVPTMGLTYAWSRFLGGGLDDSEVLNRARQASPLSYLDGNDPPILIIQGASDNIVPPEQSQILSDAVKNAGIKTSFISLPGVNHSYGSASNVNKNFSNATLSFFDLYLK